MVWPTRVPEVNRQTTYFRNSLCVPPLNAFRNKTKRIKSLSYHFPAAMVPFAALLSPLATKKSTKVHKHEQESWITFATLVKLPVNWSFTLTKTNSLSKPPVCTYCVIRCDLYGDLLFLEVLEYHLHSCNQQLVAANVGVRVWLPGDTPSAPDRGQ